MGFLCRTCPRVKVRRGKSPVRQTRGFPYRHGLRDGFGSARPGFPYRSPRWIGPAKLGFPVPVSTMDFSGQMTFCRRKVRLRVICPAEDRFGGENRLPAQIRPEPGFGGQIHANREFVRQTRDFPYRLVSAMDLVRQGRVFPYRTKQMRRGRREKP